MLKINLLPPYIYEGKKRTTVLAVWVVVFLVVVGGLLFLKSKTDAETANWQQQDASVQADKTAAQNAQTETQKVQADSKEIVDKATFVRNARIHDEDVYPAVYNNIVRYTWNRVKYDSITPSGDTVAIQAYAPLLRDVGQYILYMENNKDISRVDIRMNSIPGYPPSYTGQQQNGFGGGQQQFADMRPASGHPFGVTLHLVKAIPAGPTYGSAGGGAAAGAGGPGMGMPGGSMGGGAMGGPPMMSGGMSGAIMGGEGKMGGKVGAM